MTAKPGVETEQPPTHRSQRSARRRLAAPTLEARTADSPRTAQPWAVVVRGLRLRFGRLPALRGLTFKVPWGERLAILGPNGAGKTTLLRVLAGALQPGDGDLRLAGLDPASDGLAVRTRLGVMSHQTYLYGELTAVENLRLYGCLYGVQHLQERIGPLLEEVGLGDQGHERVGNLSRGLQQRLAIARAVLHEPDILLLDEPDTGLDLSAQHLLERLVRGGDSGRTVLMATHDLDQARRLCHRAIVLVEGRLVADLPGSDLHSEILSSLYRGNPLARSSS